MKGTAPNAPKDSAGSLALSKGAKSDAAKGHSREQYLSYKGESATKGKSPNAQFSLPDFVPGPPQDDSSSLNFGEVRDALKPTHTRTLEMGRPK